MSGKIDYTELTESVVLCVRDKAVAFENDENGQFWIPKSQLRTDVLNDCEEGEEISPVVQTWFAKKENLL